MATMRVLVTDDSHRHALGIVRSLGAKGIQVAVLANTPVALASRSRFCSVRYPAPAATSSSFAATVLELAHRVPFDLVIPVSYPATLALSLEKAALERVTRLEVADFDKIRIAGNKVSMCRLAGKAGVPAPKTFAPACFEDAVQASVKLRYPAVIKGTYESENKKVDYVHTRGELLDLYRPLCERSVERSSPPPLIQEYIPGFGCAFFALYQQGVCKRIFMHKRVRENPPAGGVSCCAASFYDPKLGEYGKLLLDRFGWHGVAMVEFRYDERDGDYRLMEVNPRFWGSLDLALAAGVDFPYYLCQMARGEHLAYSEDYNRNLRYHWPVLEMQHLLRRPSSLLPIVADVLRPEVQSNVWWSDLKPNLFELSSRARDWLERRLAANRQHSAGVPAVQK